MYVVDVMSSESSRELSVQGKATPIYFGAASARAFGFYDAGHQAKRRACGVVVCAPLGYEGLCAYRGMRHTAERLAAAGFPTLRFDYHGTGDSSGSDRDPDRVRAWLDTIHDAIDELVERSGATEVCLLGVRLGATLATVAAAERGRATSLVLWAPCAKGRAYVRGVKALSGMASDQRSLERGAGVTGDENDIDSAGFVLTAQTAAALSKLDLMALDAKPAARALIVGRDDTRGDEALVRSFEALGVATTLIHPPGFAEMMAEPHDTAVPEVALSEIEAWLLASHGPAKTPPRDAAIVGAAGLDLVATTTAPHAAPSTDAPVAIREEPFSFGEGDRLFGILTQPKAAAAGHAPPAIILLNSGSVHRIAVNRMNVTLARAWAALGFRVLRMDIGGIGDSAHAPGYEENVCYSKFAVEDVERAMRALRDRTGADRFVLSGLCSGAYLTFQTALRGGPVVGAMLINPLTFYWKEGDTLEVAPSKTVNDAKHYESSLLRVESWKKLVRGDVDLRRALGVAKKRVEMIASARVRRVLVALGVGKNDVENVSRDMKKIVARGIDELMVFSAGDPGLDYLALHATDALAALGKADRFRFEIIEGADHVFTPLSTQNRLHELLTEHIRSRFGGPSS